MLLLSCLAISAGQRYQAATLEIENVKAELSGEAVGLKTNSIKHVKASAKAVAMSDFNGTYDWGFRSLLTNSPKNELVITVDDEATGAATISGFPQNFKVAATIDLKANTVTIANMQDLGKDGAGDQNYFYLKPVDTSTGATGDGASSAKATVGTIKGNTITFPSLDVWAIGDPANEAIGWWCMTYANVLTKQEEKEFYGTATVSGDMYFTMFNKTATDYTVEVYKNSDATELLVKDPLKGLYAAQGRSSVSPDMIIDASIPDNLLIDSFSLGINGGDTNGIYYGMSVSANQQDIANTPEANRCTLKKDDKSVVITIPTKGLFLWPSKTTSLYYANKTPVTITIDISSNGVDDIISDSDENVPVEYFNLQGQRINEPAAGQLVIKRQGKKVTKMIVR